MIERDREKETYTKTSSRERDKRKQLRNKIERMKEREKKKERNKVELDCARRYEMMMVDCFCMFAMQMFPPSFFTSTEKVSISPTFYEQILGMQISKEQ